MVFKLITSRARTASSRQARLSCILRHDLCSMFCVQVYALSTLGRPRCCISQTSSTGNFWYPMHVDWPLWSGPSSPGCSLSMGCSAGRTKWTLLWHWWLAVGRKGVRCVSVWAVGGREGGRERDVCLCELWGGGERCLCEVGSNLGSNILASCRNVWT